MAKPEKLEPTPDESQTKKVDSPADMKTIVRSLPNSAEAESPSTGIVGMDLYTLLMEDAPMKLTEDQVGFVRGGGSDQGACGGCIHYYVGKVAKRKVCEIFRPADESNIEAGDVCRFFSIDSENFPLQKEKITTTKKGPERSGPPSTED